MVVFWDSLFLLVFWRYRSEKDWDHETDLTRHIFKVK
jgi:hypothetical protein